MNLTKKINQKYQEVVRIILFASVQIICIKLMIDYLIYDKYQSVTWGAKAIVVFLFLVAFLDMIQKLKFLIKGPGDDMLDGSSSKYEK